MATGDPSAATVIESAAHSVQAPQCGFSVATTGVSASKDLSRWIDRYIRISCETAAHYVVFAATDVTVSTYMVVTSATGVNTLGVPDEIDIGGAGAVYYVVPKGKPLVIFRTKSGAGRIRIRPA